MHFNECRLCPLCVLILVVNVLTRVDYDDDRLNYLLLFVLSDENHRVLIVKIAGAMETSARKQSAQKGVCNQRGRRRVCRRAWFI